MTAGRDEYGSIEVAACHSVLLELMQILGEHRANMVLIGGLVPSLLPSEATETHSGSLDIDMVVDHRNLDSGAYASIEDLLLKHGYHRDDKIPSRFIRTIEIGGQTVDVPLDLLAGHYAGTGSSHRHQQIDELMLRKVRGGDVVHSDSIEVELSGRLPDGSFDTARCRVVHPAYFIMLKAFAIEDRLNSKDCYDLYYVLKYNPGGVDELVEDCKRLVSRPLLEDMTGILEVKFESVDHRGPHAVTDFQGVTDPEEIDMVRRDVFERVNTLASRLREWLAADDE